MKSFLTVVLIIVPSLWFGYKGDEVIMGLCIVMGALVGAFLNLDKFERFSGAGFEAEMRKEVEKAVEEAYATIDNLKELAKPLFGSIIMSLTKEGRFFFGDPEFRDKDHYKDQIIDVANKLGIYEGDLINQLDEYHRIHTWDLYNQFVETLHDHIYGQVKPHFTKYNIRDSVGFPSEQTLNEIFKQNNMQLNESSNKKLKTYLYYLQNKSFLGIEE